MPPQSLQVTLELTILTLQLLVPETGKEKKVEEEEEEKEEEEEDEE